MTTLWQAEDVVVQCAGQILDTFKPVRIETRRAVQQIPSATVVFEPVADASERLWKDCAKAAKACAPGTELSIRFKNAELFTGLVTEQRMDWRERQLTVRVKHPLQALMNTQRSQVFEDKSDADVLQQLLKAHNVKVGQVTGMNATLPQLVQWACSDWQWLRARLGAYGVWLIPKRDGVDIGPPKLGGKTHTIYAHRSSDDEAAVLDLQWQFRNDTLADSLSVAYWDVTQQVMSSALKAAKPTLGKGGLDPAALKPLSQLAWQLTYSVPMTSTEAQALADARYLAQLAAGVQVHLTVQSSQASLQYELGDTLMLSGFDAAFDGQGMISEVGHQWVAGALHTTLATGVPVQRTVDASVLPRAPGLATGVVQPHQVDKGNLARLRVKLPALGDTPLWARLGAPYASNGVGLCLYPEAGDEVILAFMDEDPRYPVILGSMHNPKNTAPYPPSDENAKKGLVLGQHDAQQGWLFDVQQKSLKLQNGKDSITIKDDTGVTLNSEKDVSVTAQKVALNSKQSMTFNSDQGATVVATQTQIKAKQQLALQGAAGVTVKGAKVDLTR
ncbi:MULTISPECIES: phage baseplate assembly protein V [Burkholderiaceae]|uniref:phage baseplate assembly protein V n=1 Tax=Burkholderiaceae TaxID=119060 RepID=UPI0009698E3E|nr:MULTISPECIES: phage baseplate assembly protein V [Burkholderiaceae]MCG1040901.1 hypothetical protein [Mycetohabitans sp. B7]SIT64871.1 Uncharacterized conserved protein, implicated in type VI secretion and phage assembly [Burkholderia sp. b14]